MSLDLPNESVSRRSTRWRQAGLLAIVFGALCAAFAFAWSSLRRTPRCDVEPLERLGRDLEDDDPVERLDRVAEVVEALRHSCAVVSFETRRAATDALGAPPVRHPGRRRQSSPRWVVTGSKRYGCGDQAGHSIGNSEDWRRCLELAGLPEDLVGRRSIQPNALWTMLMLEDLGVSQPAARQLGWVLSEGLWLPAPDAERTLVHSPVVAIWTAVPPPRTATILSAETNDPERNFFEGYVMDRNVTVAQMQEARVVGPARFHAYSVALGPAFPADIWIPLQVQWTSLDCPEPSDCALPFADDQASRVATLYRGKVVPRERDGGSRGHAHLLVPEQQETWADILTAVMLVAPTTCGGDELSSGCEDPWVTLWLASH